LGLEPTRGSSGTLFPIAKPAPFQIVQNASATNMSNSSPTKNTRNQVTKRVKTRDAATADVAIGQALNTFLQRKKKYWASGKKISTLAYSCSLHL